ncbi:MAG: N-acetyl-D-Glu racemase DgcA [Pseudomonadota bacterium]
MTWQATIEQFELAQTFAISRGAKHKIEVVVAQITRDGLVGRGEAVPYPRFGHAPEPVAVEIEALDPQISREGLQQTLPAGPARNAADCALWDLEVKEAAKRAEARGQEEALAHRVATAFTLSLDTPSAMAEAAQRAGQYGLLKLKLGGLEDLERLRAVRAARPDATLVLDANEGWDAASYLELLPELQALEIALIEQPFPADHDDALRDVPRPIPICADESFHDTASLAPLLGKYDAINIKLDKTGGLTEAMRALRAAKDAQLLTMLGCMVCTSLSIAPALRLAREVDFVDLDGALWLKKDRRHGLSIKDGYLAAATPALWG